MQHHRLQETETAVSKTLTNINNTSCLLWPLIPLQIGPGWGGASTEPQFVQLQVRAPGAGGRGRGSGGWRWGGGGRQSDREVSWWGAWIPIPHHDRGVWRGRGRGGDGGGSIGYELWTHSQVLSLLSPGHCSPASALTVTTTVRGHSELYLLTTLLNRDHFSCWRLCPDRANTK